MSRIYDALRSAEERRRGRGGERDRAQRACRVIAVASNKGGVGKTTVATNLAVYLRALREDLPILAIGLDDQPMPQRMFALPGDGGDGGARTTIVEALRTGSLDGAVRPGQYGVDYVPSSPAVAQLKREHLDAQRLLRLLERAGRSGVVVVDTKSDLEILTQNALVAADLTIVVVKDQASLIEADRLFELLSALGRKRSDARVLLSLVDRRVKYADADFEDVCALLSAEVSRRGLPRFETFLSRSPKVEGLHTNPAGRVEPVLHAAPGSLVHDQLRRLAQEVMDWLDGRSAPTAAAGARAAEPPMPPVAPGRRGTAPSLKSRLLGTRRSGS